MTAPNPYQRRILAALNILGKHVYAPAETPTERAERRRADRLRAAIALPKHSRARRRAVAHLEKTTARAERRAARKANA